jgi:hypothetical protein
MASLEFRIASEVWSDHIQCDINFLTIWIQKCGRFRDPLLAECSECEMTRDFKLDYQSRTGALGREMSCCFRGA